MKCMVLLWWEGKRGPLDYSASEKICYVGVCDLWSDCHNHMCKSYNLHEKQAAHHWANNLDTPVTDYGEGGEQVGLLKCMAHMVKRENVPYCRRFDLQFSLRKLPHSVYIHLESAEPKEGSVNCTATLRKCSIEGARRNVDKNGNLIL